MKFFKANSNGERIFGGIMLLLIAAALFFLAVNKELALLSVPAWKWFFGAVLVLILADRIRKPGPVILFPVVLLFLLFEKEIGTLAGWGENFCNNWLVLLGTVVLYSGAKLLLRGNKGKPFMEFGKGKHSEKTSANSVGGSIGERVEYFDANETEFSVGTFMGEMNIWFRNTDCGKTDPITLRVSSSMGEIVVHVPADWWVEASGGIGDINIRHNPDAPTRKMTVDCRGFMGEMNVVS